MGYGRRKWGQKFTYLRVLSTGVTSCHNHASCPAQGEAAQAAAAGLTLLFGWGVNWARKASHLTQKTT